MPVISDTSPIPTTNLLNKSKSSRVLSIGSLGFIGSPSSVFHCSGFIWHNKNAVFNQLLAALITYILLKWLYCHSKSLVLPVKSIPYIRFKEQLEDNQLQVEWVIAIGKVLDKYVFLSFYYAFKIQHLVNQQAWSGLN